MTVKKAVLRALLGFPLGVFIGVVILLGISAGIGDGGFHVADVSFIQSAGSELMAAVCQFSICGLVGMGFALGSCFFEIDRWSITKQTAAHFALTTGIMLPVAWFGNWVGRSLGALLLYAAISVGIYVVIWLIQYLIWYKRINKMNEKLKG